MRRASSGVDVLLDDRDERPGVKFADMELIGIPHQVVIGERSLGNGMVEYKQRAGGDREEVAVAEIVQRLLRELRTLMEQD